LTSLSERAGDSHVSINRMLIELPFAGLIFMGLVILVVFLAVTIGDNPDTPQIDGYIIKFITSVSEQAAASLRGPLPLILITTLISIFLTEVFNNTTVILILFPIITSVSAGMGIDPLYLLLSVLLGASAAFMLPIATSVNAVVFGSMPDFSVKRLLFRGFILNLAGAVIITLFVLLMI
jgi:sodium-dependent dicarboxylate transporter 2/3/5